MALVRTARIGAQSSTGIGTGSVTTASFTPSNNCLLVAVVSSSSSTTISAANLTIADSLGTLTWTSQLAVTHTLNTEAIRFWTAPVASGASMTVTFDAGTDSTDQYTFVIVDYTGYNTVTPVGATGSKNTGTDNTYDGAYSFTLSGAPATTSEVFAGFHHDDNAAVSCTPGAAFTEINDIDTSGHSGLEVQIRTGSTSTTVDWVDVDTAGTTNIFRGMGAAIEIQAGAATAAGVPPSPLVGPGATGPLAFQWQQQTGVDPIVVTAAAQPWAQTILTPEPPVAVPFAAVYQGLYPGSVETVPQAFLIQAIPVVQLPPFAAVYRGADPNRVETTPLALLLAAVNVPQPLQAVQVVVPGFDPRAVESVPQSFLLTAAAIAQPVFPPQVFVALQVGTPPVTSFFVPTIQAINLAQPLQAAQILEALNPSSVETVPVPRLVQAQALPQPLQSLLLARGLHDPIVATVPVPRLVAGTAAPQPLQTVQVLYALTPGTPPQVFRFVPTVQATAIVIRLPDGRVYLGLTPGLAPSNAPVITYPTGFVITVPSDLHFAGVPSTTMFITLPSGLTIPITSTGTTLPLADGNENFHS
jgi:hypothetical protein